MFSTNILILLFNLYATAEQLSKLERLQNLAIRFIFGLRLKHDHISNFRAQVNRCDMHILSFLYRVLYDPNLPA